MTNPILVGGNGHSGTRIFAEVLAAAGVSMGIPKLTRVPSSFDLNIRNLLRRWVGPYLHHGLSESELRRMRRQFALRLRLYFPLRFGAWGFKNPRSLLILPFYHQLFPQMKFVHVIRDGRDVTLGNVLAGNEDYISAFMEAQDLGRSAEERMMLFWGRSNARAQDYGSKSLGPRYLMIRFEDLCRQPEEVGTRLLKFAGADPGRITDIRKLVKIPKSIGRWKAFDSAVVEKVQTVGKPWLERFGYETPK